MADIRIPASAFKKEIVEGENVASGVGIVYIDAQIRNAMRRFEDQVYLELADCSTMQSVVPEFAVVGVVPY